MAETVSMPKLGFDMAEGNLVRWLKKVNDPVEKGQALAEIETDKATVEVEAPYSGVVLQLIVEEGTSVPIGSPIAIIGQPGEKVEIPSLDKTAKPEKIEKKVDEIQSVPFPVVTAPGETTFTASPLARRIALEKNVDLSKVSGTGPGGRIVRKDIELVMASVSAGAETVSPSFKTTQLTDIPGDERIPLNKLRSAIGRRMLESKQSIPHFYVTSDIDVERLLDLREQINSLIPDGEKLSINDFIIKAAALALRQYPNLNSSISGSEIIRHGHIHIGVAVSVEGGLLTIVVRDADRKDLREISREVKEMAGRVRIGKVKSEDIEGSTFSISNLGMYDVENFAAIINPPEVAILAIASARETVVIDNGEAAAGTRMKATISADHRVTDGVEAAKFLQTLKLILETPVQLLIS
jgi:pyruvate dehydrogenase E2 component (dihydrolipoamide acetyltransferase)